jgi:hypothetical protein
MRTVLAPFVLLLVACGGDAGGGGKDSASSDTRVPEEPFDPACAGQLMFTQTVGTVAELEVDWSGLTADSDGEPVDATSVVALVHWYILGMPPSTLNARLCDDVDFSSDVVGANVSAFTPGSTSTTVNIGEGWRHETGVIALYDTTDSNAGADPFAAAVFVFDPDSTAARLTVEGRGDVWTAP